MRKTACVAFHLNYVQEFIASQQQFKRIARGETAREIYGYCKVIKLPTAYIGKRDFLIIKCESHLSLSFLPVFYSSWFSDYFR